MRRAFRSRLIRRTRDVPEMTRLAPGRRCGAAGKRTAVCVKPASTQASEPKSKIIIGCMTGGFQFIQADEALVAGVDSQTPPMVIYAMARRGASPVTNAISAIIAVFCGALVLISERVRES